MNLKINDDNYLEYKKVFEIIWRHQSKLLNKEIVEKYSPIKVINDWEEKNKSIAKKGLKEGLRDIIVNLKELPDDTIQRIDNELKSNNLPNIYKLKGLINSTQKNVIKRKEIKTIDEFYTIKELVVDLTTDLNSNERNDLSKYMEEFEQRQNNKR